MLGLPLLLALTLAQNQPPAPDLQIPRVLTVTYSDGRVLPHILTPRGVCEFKTLATCRFDREDVWTRLADWLLIE